MVVLNAQVLALTLIPLLSGVVPGGGSPVIDLPTLLGIDRPLAKTFMVGAWKHTDQFMRWGITEKKRAVVENTTAKGYMCLREDGAATMVNLFKPEKGRWDVSGRGIVIYDPDRPERGAQHIPVMKRDQDRIWLLLPFAGGATGIGMVRVAEDAMAAEIADRQKRPALKPVLQRTSSGSTREDKTDYSVKFDQSDIFKSESGN